MTLHANVTCPACMSQDCRKSGWRSDVERQGAPAVSAPIAVDPHTLRAAQEGDAEAQVRIAKVQLFGGVQSGELATEAVRWLQSAAEKGHPAAMVMLGKLYRSGFGVLQDYGQALKWIRTAAERGDPDGMLELGRLKCDGVGMPRDPVLAYVWFDRAAAALQVDAVRHRTDVARVLTADRLKEVQAQSLAPEASEADAKRAKGNGR